VNVRDWVAIGTVVVGIGLVLLAIGLTRPKKARQDQQEPWTIEQVPSEPISLPSSEIGMERGRKVLEDQGMRYVLSIADWGPHFDGSGDTLHRYRWVLADADYTMRKALGMEVPEHGAMVMLGNAPTIQDACVEALTWIEENAFPVVLSLVIQP
jgi:hypothetical protein